MKTTTSLRSILIATLFIVFAVYTATAGHPAIAPAIQLQKVIKESIVYPERAVRSCCTGSIDVFFTIDENGKIKIEKTYADNLNLEQALVKQLEKLDLKSLKLPYNEHYKVTVTFKLIG